MIYQVFMDGVSIFNYDYPDMVLLEPTLEMELNTSGSFDFTMPARHVFYDNVHLLTSDIEVYEGNHLLWFGRPIGIQTDYYRQKKVSCEGALAFFNDSVQDAQEYDRISIRDFFRLVVANHNRQVASNRQFTVGTMTIPDKMVYRKLHYEQTMDVLKRQCLAAEGGYFFVRREGSVNYIDWLSEMPYTCNQPIEFGLNLLDISGNRGGEEVATCVLPLGDTDHTTGNPLTVESVNNGKKIVESEAVVTYGKITKAVTFSGVSDPHTLFEDGVEYLSSLQFDRLSIECDASELHFLNPNFEAFRVGQRIHCVSKPHLVEKDLPLTRMSLKLDTATKQITLGTPVRQTLTEIYADIKTEEVKEMQEDVSDLKDDVTGIQEDIGDIQDNITAMQDEMDNLSEGDGWHHWIGTQEEYDALSEKNPETVYFIESGGV
ncbi:phage upper tail fiber protein [Bilifractor sp. LCP19S3_H10]|uniref:phage upper tail fiber protein n=1 Tax=Lachnospiraceae TaxID=186803 RepID=UPI003F8DAB03